MILASASELGVGLSVATAVAYVLPALAARRLTLQTTRALALCAWLLHAAVLAVALFVDAPRFGFAPALSVTAWLVVTVYAVENYIYPQLETRWTWCAMGSVAVLLALLFPGKLLHPAASPWLPLHWALGIASYGLFAVAVAHAWLMSRAEARMRLAADTHTGMPLMTMERLTFRFVTAGFVLLSATLVAGILFSESLYGMGATWRWNHKTVFSVLSWASFATLLAGRSRFGWRGRRAVQILYTGAALLLLAYVGSRFVLEVFLGRAA